MNIRQVLKAFTALRQLTDDESALLETLRGATDAERELLVETLAPQKVMTKRAGKKSASKGASKSARAQSLSGAIHRTPKPKVDSDADDVDPNAHCQKEFAGGFICDEPADANVHHLRGATGYHEFDAGKSSAPRAGAKSSTNGGAVATTANSGDETVSAGAVAGGSNEHG